MDTMDRWALTLAALVGEPLPPLPALPGRKHTAPPERRDEVLAAWERLNRKTSRASAWTWATSKAHEAGR